MTLMDRPEFQDFRVIQPKMLFSMSEMRISKTSISFNRACASELGYPEEVCLVASEEGDIIGLLTAPTNKFVGFCCCTGAMTCELRRKDVTRRQTMEMM